MAKELKRIADLNGQPCTGSYVQDNAWQNVQSRLNRGSAEDKLPPTVMQTCPWVMIVIPSPNSKDLAVTILLKLSICLSSHKSCYIVLYGKLGAVMTFEGKKIILCQLLIDLL